MPHIEWFHKNLKKIFTFIFIFEIYKYVIDFYLIVKYQRK